MANKIDDVFASKFFSVRLNMQYTSDFKIQLGLRKARGKDFIIISSLNWFEVAFHNNKITWVWNVVGDYRNTTRTRTNEFYS